MKKVTFYLMLFLAMTLDLHAQVQIGEGTDETTRAPFEPYYGYSYVQSIYLANELTAGTITSIKWYYSGTTLLPNSQDLVIYMGHTNKSTFNGYDDFIPFSEFTQVYTGPIPVTGPGWITLTLTTPFAYNGTGNLVVAVDENHPGWDTVDDDFFNSYVNVWRTVAAYHDDINPNPANLVLSDLGRLVTPHVPNVIFGGISESCPKPTNLAISNPTNTTANLSWQASGTETAWEVLILESGSSLPNSNDSGVPVTGTPTYQATSLNAATNHVFYVRANCGSGVFSPWSAGFNFTTTCNPFPGFEENFDGAGIADGGLPTCWSKILVTNYGTTFLGANSAAPYSPPYNAFLYSTDTQNVSKLLLITPPLADLPANTHRVKFKAAGNTNLLIGTMSDPTNANTFNLVQTISLSNAYTEYIIPFNTSTTDQYIGFKLEDVNRFIRIDDFVWETTPLSLPQCALNVNAAINQDCGNFATSLTWNTVEGAEGYRISIGTTPTGNYIVDNVNLGDATAYSFTGNPATNYYYTITPYNILGAPTGCTQETFTTANDTCYCTSVPINNNNLGITNVKIADSEFTVEDVTYFDFTGDETIDLIPSATYSAFITFVTGDDYAANVWIDFNDNFVFESNEIIYSGLSLATFSESTPSLLNASFLLPLTATQGEHRMRIGTTNTAQSPPNACYSGTNGVTLDFKVNILPVPACLPPTTPSATLITAHNTLLKWTSAGTLFNIEYAPASNAFGQGTMLSGLTGSSYTLASLNPQTDYRFYIQTDCGTGSLSPWVGPFFFRTACEAFGNFEENFTSSTYSYVPECWLTNVTAPAHVVLEYNGAVEMYSNDQFNPNLFLITPILTDLPAGTNRIRFKTRTASSNTSMIIGTMTDPAAAETFTPVSTINLPSGGGFVEYTIPIPASTDKHVAFKFQANGSYRIAYIDNVIWEPVPATIPECITNLIITANTDCGNYPTLMEWTAAENADGYRVTIGTTPGGNDILNNQDIGNVLSVTTSGNYNTTYYYSIIPYNEIGTASGCTAGSFTTASTGCYCTSVPTSNDNSGITGININGTLFPNADVTYSNFSGNGAVTIYQGESANLHIAFATGYTYYTYVFIDLNDNYVFEPFEQLFNGESSSDNPTLYNASFILPANAPLGIHRMRLVTSDGNATPTVGDPCYSGQYGVTADFSVNVQESLSISDFDNSNFKIYPNPVSSILNFSYTQEITSVSVFNILGQQMITNTINASEGQIDLSHLATGTYLVRVTSGKETKTIKVLKK